MALLEEGNHTAVTEFILLGLTDDPVLKVILFTIILCIYLVTVSGNLSTTLLIRVSSQLHHPMYFFLSHLASVDIGYSSSVTSNMLVNFLVEENTITHLGCAIQLDSAAFFGTAECYVLAVMAYDRFVAIYGTRKLSVVTEFILVGLTEDATICAILFVVFLIIYSITLMGNMSIIMLIRGSPQLHTPMYLFLSHLAFVDIGYSSSVTTFMLRGFLTKETFILVAGCVAQLCCAVTFGSAECFLLAAMAYDRYVAICSPSALLHTDVLHSLHPPSGRFLRSIIVVTVFIIALSYVYILVSILKMRSPEGRQKAFSTCTSHLTAVTLFYGTITFIYVMPKSSYSTDQNKVVSVFYTVVIPMLNPSSTASETRMLKRP
ncbi:Olfactory receptor 508 [Microtus ochrogaster]|uniref:Olfactory receptor 508 n=1 Tax=Microtus ochrogaster TaxID=79684 RepID=A0A8J6H1T4_MICOH|nr:Olfactory receptor 508 [Microtus ochrogaster]